MVDAQAWNGEGWLTCEIQRQLRANYAISLLFRLRKLEDATWAKPPRRVVWNL